MNHYYLAWIFVSLFLLFGAIAVATEGSDRFPFWAALAVLSLGGFAITMVAQGVKTGKLRFQYMVIERMSQPRLFWAACVLFTVVGFFILAVGVWVLLSKA